MRPCIYFAPKAQLDNFQGTRLRKNLKGSLELVNLEYAKNLFDEHDLAHFLTVNDESKIDDEIDAGVKVVFSALYAEEDPSCRIFSPNKDEKELSNKALRLLNKVDLVLVPTEEDKKLLKNNDVVSRIEVLSPGVNLSRFRKTGSEEDEVFFEYSQIEKHSKCIASVGALNDKETIEKLFEIARLLPDYKFFYFGPGKHPWSSLFKRHKIPGNVKLSGLTNDEVYCSLLKQIKHFLVLGETNASSLLTLLEVMASKTDIITLNNVKNNKEILIKEKRAHVCANNEEIVATIKGIDNGKIPSLAEEGYKYAKKNSLANLGPKLVNLYQSLMEDKKHD